LSQSTSTEYFPESSLEWLLSLTEAYGAIVF